MKKSILFLAIFLSLSFLSAIDFNVNSEYPQAGAIIAKISGPFQELPTKEDFSFYRNHIRIPMDFDFKKIGDEYYLFVKLADKEPNNYSIVLEDATYLQGAKIITEDIQRNFTINDDVVSFSINKGIAITEGDFSISVHNFQSSRENITYTLGKNTGSISLYPGELSELKISVQDLPLLSLQNLEIKSSRDSYTIPVYVLGIPEIKKGINFSFELDSISVSLDLNNETKRIVYLENIGDEIIFQVKLSLDEELSKYATLSTQELFNLSAGFLYPIELSFFSDDLPRTTTGYLTARSSSLTDSISINLTFTPGYVPATEESSTKTCSEMGGFSCSNPSLCVGGIFLASDGNCCPTSCGLLDESPGSSSSSLKFFGWLILIVLLIVGVWFYLRRYRNAEGPARGIFKFLKKTN